MDLAPKSEDNYRMNNVYSFQTTKVEFASSFLVCPWHIEYKCSLKYDLNAILYFDLNAVKRGPQH